LRIEKDVFMNLGDLSGKIIDTGASVIYDHDIMCKIAELAHIVYIKDDIDVIVARFNARGPVPLMGVEGKTFEQLFDERRSLYEKYAQSTVIRNNSRNNDARLIANQILG
jgi:shikimate kinase